MWVASPWGFSEMTIQPARHECHACCLLRAIFLAFQPVVDNTRGTRVEQVVSSFHKIFRGSQLTWYIWSLPLSESGLWDRWRQKYEGRPPKSINKWRGKRKREVRQCCCRSQMFGAAGNSKYEILLTQEFASYFPPFWDQRYYIGFLAIQINELRISSEQLLAVGSADSRAGNSAARRGGDRDRAKGRGLVRPLPPRGMSRSIQGEKPTYDATNLAILFSSQIGRTCPKLI